MKDAKIRVELNFKCNGVSGIKGEILSSEKLERIGKKSGNLLLEAGLILCIDNKEVKFPVKKAVEIKPIIEEVKEEIKEEIKEEVKPVIKKAKKQKK